MGRAACSLGCAGLEGLSAKVGLWTCFWSSTMKHEKTISWPREDEEESALGGRIRADAKYPKDGKEPGRSRGKKVWRRGSGEITRLSYEPC